MSELQPFSYNITGLVSPNDDRRAARAISRSRSSSQVRGAVINDETDVSLDKIDSVSFVTSHGMVQATRVAQTQQHLELIAPAAAGRLAMLADTHAFAVLDVVSDHIQSLRRR